MYAQTILERRVRARVAALGITLDSLIKSAGVSRNTVHIWLKSGVITSKGHRALGAGLGVGPEWFADTSIDRCLEGVDAIVSTATTATNS